MPLHSVIRTQELLQKMSDEIHAQTVRCTKRRGSIADRTHGMCDYMTTLALNKLESLPLHKTAFIGIQIPQHETRGQKTHASHTLGVLYGFAQEAERHLAIWFDYACAQYGYDTAQLIKVVPKEDLYMALRQTYGGGIWQPGGCWLGQIDLNTFHRLYPAV
jgi:hypothetical protein